MENIVKAGEESPPLDQSWKFCPLLWWKWCEGNGLSHPVNEKSPTGRAFCVGRLGILFPNGESSRLCFLFRGRSINTIFVFDQRKFICGARNDFLLTDYFYAFLPIGIGDGLGGVGDLIGV